MPRKTIAVLLLAAALVSVVTPSQAAEPEVTGPQVVAALENTFGIHPSERRNHIKGTCALGEFVGTKAALSYRRSLLFSGKPGAGRRPLFAARRQSAGTGHRQKYAAWRSNSACRTASCTT
jgi:hypothetical protein